MKFFVPVIITLALLPLALGGCGDSQGVQALTAWLTDFSLMIEEYKASVGSDKSKQAEWDARIDKMTAKWAEMRGEFGADLTPQNMKKMVQKYEALMTTLTEFKETVGS